MTISAKPKDYYISVVDPVNITHTSRYLGASNDYGYVMRKAQEHAERFAGDGCLCFVRVLEFESGKAIAVWLVMPGSVQQVSYDKGGLLTTLPAPTIKERIQDFRFRLGMLEQQNASLIEGMEDAIGVLETIEPSKAASEAAIEMLRKGIQASQGSRRQLPE